MEGEGGLEPLAGVVDFEGGYPLDPLVAASARGHEPEGEAVSMGQCFVADGGGEKELIGLIDGESSGVSGDGANGDAGSVGLESGLVQYLSQRDARPVLGRVPAAGAVESGGQLRLVGGDIGIVAGEFSFDVARYLKDPAGRVDGLWVVVYPGSGGEAVAGKAGGGVGAGESSLTTGEFEAEGAEFGDLP